jgi:uncharacterized protein YdhG (YjbR/CyaY superfamily)
MDKNKTIDEYLHAHSENIRTILQSVRDTISNEAPEAVEAISYGMPTFKLFGKNMIHFAGYKDHIGIYPTSSQLEKHIPEVAEFRTGKGTLRFPLEKEIPFDLIRKIVQIRIKEIQNGKNELSSRY